MPFYVAKCGSNVASLSTCDVSTTSMIMSTAMRNSTARRSGVCVWMTMGVIDCVVCFLSRNPTSRDQSSVSSLLWLAGVYYGLGGRSDVIGRVVLVFSG